MLVSMLSFCRSFGRATRNRMFLLSLEDIKSPSQSWIIIMMIINHNDSYYQIHYPRPIEADIHHTYGP